MAVPDGLGEVAKEGGDVFYPSWEALRAAHRWQMPARYNMAHDMCEKWAVAEPDRLALWETSAKYLMYGGLALAVLGLAALTSVACAPKAPTPGAGLPTGYEQLELATATGPPISASRWRISVARCR